MMTHLLSHTCLNIFLNRLSIQSLIRNNLATHYRDPIVVFPWLFHHHFHIIRNDNPQIMSHDMTSGCWEASTHMNASKNYPRWLKPWLEEPLIFWHLLALNPNFRNPKINRNPILTKLDDWKTCLITVPNAMWHAWVLHWSCHLSCCPYFTLLWPSYGPR